MKGQTLVFEQVMLFMIGVAIFIACFGLFQIYQAHYTYVSVNDQSIGVKELVSSQILQLMKFKNNDTTAEIELVVPQTIGGERYDIELPGKSLDITTLQTGTKASSTLYMLGDSIPMSGKSASSKGKIIIYKNRNKIILG